MSCNCDSPGYNLLIASIIILINAISSWSAKISKISGSLNRVNSFRERNKLSLSVDDRDGGQCRSRNNSSIAWIYHSYHKFLVGGESLSCAVCSIRNSVSQSHSVSTHFIFSCRVNSNNLWISIYCNRCASWNSPSKRVGHSIGTRRLLSVDCVEKTDFF